MRKKPVRITRDRLAQCVNAFQGHPAFVLGNGPGLPEDLSLLDEFFTIGVNRIVYRYDPTVVMWWEANVLQDIREHLQNVQAISITSALHNRGRQYVDVELDGDMDAKVHRPPLNPSRIPVTGSSGVSAAYWAMSLGCSPIYLVGMSCRKQGKKTDFYGINPHHEKGTLSDIRKTTRRLLQHPDVHRIETVYDLLSACTQHKGMGRLWYRRQLIGHFGDDLAGMPAFILDSGRLKDFNGLRNRFTIGLRDTIARFEPTVYLWTDRQQYRHLNQKIDATKSLLVCDQACVKRQFHVGLKAWHRTDYPNRLAKPFNLILGGGEAITAIRWAMSLGCWPIYFLGDGDIRNLAIQYDGNIRCVRDGGELQEAISQTGWVDQKAIRRAVQKAIGNGHG